MKHVNRLFRRLITILGVMGMSFCLASTVLAANPNPTSEYIQSMDVSVNLAKDQTATITERIEYHFPTGQSKHGIYRDIPEEYRRNGSNYNVRYHVTKVTRNDVAEPYQLMDMGNNLRIKIGRGDVFVTDTQIYEITYQTQRVVNSFADHRELYWNVTGNEWNIPILRARVTVHGPEGATKSTCYVGPYGSSDQSCTHTITDGILKASAQNPLDAQEGLTIAVSYPREAFTSPPLLLGVRWFIQDNPIVLLPLLTFLIMGVLWRITGKDPKGKNTIIPFYEEPRHLPPGLLSALHHQGFGWPAVTATILDLARRGYLRIVWQGNDHYYFLKLKSPDKSLHSFEETILKGIFPYPNQDTMQPRQLQGTFPKVITQASRQGFEELKSYGFLNGNPESIRGHWLAFVGIFALVTIIGGAIGFGILGFFVGAVSSFIALLFAWQMPKTTKEGSIASQEVKGFQWYLRVSEKDRLAFHDAPLKKPEDFSRYLPAAVALGVARDWAHQFDNIAISPPDYVSGITKVGSAIQFVSTIESIQSNAIRNMYQTASASRSSASSGSSGISGGFSGGGFGGGGGGSW